MEAALFQHKILRTHWNVWFDITAWLWQQWFAVEAKCGKVHDMSGLTEQDGDANETEDSSQNQASDAQSVVVCRKVVVGKDQKWSKIKKT